MRFLNDFVFVALAAQVLSLVTLAICLLSQAIRRDFRARYGQLARRLRGRRSGDRIGNRERNPNVAIDE